MNKIAVIGHFGSGENFCDGQTVKTRNLANLLEKDGNFDIVLVDTYFFKRNTFKLIFDTLSAVLRCKHIFLLVSTNGMNFYLRFFYYLSKLCKRHVYHYIIGSELLDMVLENKNLVRYLNSLDVNWFEYERGTQHLRQQGVQNVETLPNFKRITPVENAKPYKDVQGIFNFCTFSRVMREKGITDAIHAIHSINQKQGKICAHLDVYGPIEDVYQQEFDALTKEYADEVRYMGITDSSSSVEQLKNYYALLFPTYWRGEGVPGTLIDSFASGIPVIASDWRANKDIVRDGETGLIYPNNQFQTLEDAILWALQNPDEMNRMRVASRAEYEKYTPASILSRILLEIGRKEG